MRIKYNLLAFGLIALAGCSGGGDDGPFFGGVYDVSMTRVLDNCGTGVDYYFDSVMTVNQDDRRIVLNSGEYTLTGDINDDDQGFTTYTSEIVDGCTQAVSIVYDDVDDDGDFGAGLAIGINCGNVSCEVAYGGVAIKR